MITIAVAGGSRPEILEFVTQAHKRYSNELIFIIFDTEENIDSNNLWTYVPCETENEMVHRAVKSVASNQAQILVKGIVPTHAILKEVLREEHDLKKQGILSHAALINLPQLDRPLLLADAGMNITPSKDILIGIVDNTVDIAFKIGLKNPRVALLSAAENYNPKMPSSVMAKEVTDYYKDSENMTIYGPISFDLALSKEAVTHKGFQGPIEGDADVIIVPNIDVGNALYKALVLFGGAITGGTIVGTKVPIVLTSRSDAIESKLYSLEFAIKQIKNK